MKATEKETREGAEEIGPGPCGHIECDELGWVFPCADDVANDVADPASCPTAIYVARGGQEQRFAAASVLYRPKIQAFLDEGDIESVSVWSCSLCVANWIVPDPRTKKRRRRKHE